MVITNGNEIVDAYTNGVQVVEIYSFGVKVWPVSTPGPANNEIWYTSSDGNIVTPHIPSTDTEIYVFGANLVSNTYSNGYGVMSFDGDVTHINTAFKGKTTLTWISLPSTVTEIGLEAFRNCTYLQSIVAPPAYDFNYGFSSFAFSGCLRLESIDLNGVTVLPYCCFNDCESLTDIVLPSTLTKINDWVFGHSGLEKVTIPSSVIEIGMSAFNFCTDLSEVIVNCTVPPTLGINAFNNTSPNLLIKVPASSLNDYLTAPGWSDYANRIVGYIDTDEIDFTTLGLANTQVVDVDTYGPFSSGDMEVQFTTTNQNYTSKYYTSGTAVRVYRENSVVISSSRTISQIKFTWTGGSSYEPSSDVATPSGYDYQTYIWTGSANQVTLTRPNEANHWRLKSVLVTYQ